MHRRLPHARGHTGADVAGVNAAAPLEPDVLPRFRSAVGHLPVGLGEPQAGDGPDRVGAEGNTRAHFTEGRGGLEQLDVEVGVTAQVKRQGDAGDTAADDADTQGRLLAHVRTHDGVVGVAPSWRADKY
ncbi:hypothetical protein D3C76_1383540 [compost metagenome]